MTTLHIALFMFFVLAMRAEALSFQLKLSHQVRQSNRCKTQRNQSFFLRQSVRQCASSEKSDAGDDSDGTDYDTEETLLQIHLSPLPGVAFEDALSKISKYTRSFPFAVVLPVQPLQYMPTSDGGVDIRFLRKKTKEKGSLDGGLRFFIRKERNGIEVIVKRNSEGQSISKMFSEKLIVQSFVKGISGDDVDTTGKAPSDVVVVESFFHKWMQST